MSLNKNARKADILMVTRYDRLKCEDGIIYYHRVQPIIRQCLD